MCQEGHIANVLNVVLITSIYSVPLKPINEPEQSKIAKFVFSVVAVIFMKWNVVDLLRLPQLLNMARELVLIFYVIFL